MRRISSTRRDAARPAVPGFRPASTAALEPVLEPWGQRFPGPFLYYSGRRLVPAPLGAFIEFVREAPSS